MPDFVTFPWMSETLIDVAGLTLLTAVLFLILSRVIVVLARRASPVTRIVRGVRNLLLPTGMGLVLFTAILGRPGDDWVVRSLATLLGIELIWLTALTIERVGLPLAFGGEWRSRVPSLMLDVGKLLVIGLAVCLLVGRVWERDISAVFATLGVGSIVLGLALQDTLSNVFAGIALFFERPFQKGDWIKIGEKVGEVVELNWRAVQIRTRLQGLVVVPNSIIAKAHLENYSRPTPVHGVLVELFFSYNDPPLRVKNVLHDVAAATPGVRNLGETRVRTLKFSDSSIVYQVRLFLWDCIQEPDIVEDFMTRVWYAARRNRLTIPFPMRTVQMIEPESNAPTDVRDQIRCLLESVDLFSSLSPQELADLAEESTIEHYGPGEYVVKQGDAGVTMFLIRAGSAAIMLADGNAPERQIASLRDGQIFGEISLLTGQPRAASVRATGELELVVIHHHSMTSLLKHRPELASRMAEIVSARQASLVAASQADQPVPRLPGEDSVIALALRIRSFFGI